MHLTRLKAECFRNINALDLNFDPRLNLIYGENGSGKSTLLEIIYCLSRARSFRTHLYQSMIQYDAPYCSAFGVVDSELFSTTVGYQKFRQGKTHLRIGMNKQAPSLIEFSQILPIQLIHPECYELLNQGPKLRRQFVDWGVFHSEYQFLSVWRRFNRALKQRNAAIQARKSVTTVSAWDVEITKTGETLSKYRKEYLEQFQKLASEFLGVFLEKQNLTLLYHPGWDPEKTLIYVLQQNLEKDLDRGYTSAGPHRFDLTIKLNGLSVESVLSRGEQKRLICALHLTQGQLFKQLTSKMCVYLLDDIFLELDYEAQQNIWKQLMKMNAQIFMTAIDGEFFKIFKEFKRSKRFYIQNGCVSEV